MHHIYHILQHSYSKFSKIKHRDLNVCDISFNVSFFIYKIKFTFNYTKVFSFNCYLNSLFLKDLNNPIGEVLN